MPWVPVSEAGAKTGEAVAKTGAGRASASKSDKNATGKAKEPAKVKEPAWPVASSSRSGKGAKADTAERGGHEGKGGRGSGEKGGGKAQSRKGSGKDKGKGKGRSAETDWGKADWWAEEEWWEEPVWDEGWDEAAAWGQAERRPGRTTMGKKGERTSPTARTSRDAWDESPPARKSREAWDEWGGEAAWAGADSWGHGRDSGRAARRASHASSKPTARQSLLVARVMRRASIPRKVVKSGTGGAMLKQE